MIFPLAATGRISYAKSARIYIQQMRELQETYPWLFKKKLQKVIDFGQDCGQILWLNKTLWGSLRTDKRAWYQWVCETFMSSESKYFCKYPSSNDWYVGLEYETQWVACWNRCIKAHVEMGVSRRSRDYLYCQKILEWPQIREIFLNMKIRIYISFPLI